MERHPKLSAVLWHVTVRSCMRDDRSPSLVSYFLDSPRKSDSILC